MSPIAEPSVRSPMAFARSPPPRAINPITSSTAAVTKESMLFFRARRARWQAAPRPKTQPLPPPLPPYTPPVTVEPAVTAAAPSFSSTKKPLDEKNAPVKVSQEGIKSAAFTVSSFHSSVSSMTTTTTLSSSIFSVPSETIQKKEEKSFWTTAQSPSFGVLKTSPAPSSSFGFQTSLTTIPPVHPFATTGSSTVVAAAAAAAAADKQETIVATAKASSTSPPLTAGHRQRLVAFYEKHNPSKLGSVDQTLETYQGREEELFAKLTAKYEPATTVASPYPLPEGTGPRCFLEVAGRGRVVVQLFANHAPLAVENFRCLCTGEKGMARAAGNKPLCYQGSTMHRIVPNFCVQGGDMTAHDGTGGESIYPPGSANGDMWGKFRDETFLKHNAAGLLSYANNGPNRNGSQFFFTLRELPHLNGKHVVFGKVVQGMAIVEAMGALATDAKQRPTESVVIADCGQILDDGTEITASLCSKERTSTSGMFGASFSPAATASFGAVATSSSNSLPPFGPATGVQPSVFGGGASRSPFSSSFQTTTSVLGKPKENTPSVFGALPFGRETFSFGVSGGASGATQSLGETTDTVSTSCAAKESVVSTPSVLLPTKAPPTLSALTVGVGANTSSFSFGTTAGVADASKSPISSFSEKTVVSTTKTPVSFCASGACGDTPSAFSFGTTAGAESASKSLHEASTSKVPAILGASATSKDATKSGFFFGTSGGASLFTSKSPAASLSQTTMLSAESKDVESTIATIMGVAGDTKEPLAASSSQILVSTKDGSTMLGTSGSGGAKPQRTFSETMNESYLAKNKEELPASASLRFSVRNPVGTDDVFDQSALSTFPNKTKPSNEAKNDNLTSATTVKAASDERQQPDSKASASMEAVMTTVTASLTVGATKARAKASQSRQSGCSSRDSAQLATTSESTSLTVDATLIRGEASRSGSSLKATGGSADGVIESSLSTLCQQSKPAIEMKKIKLTVASVVDTSRDANASTLMASSAPVSVPLATGVSYYDSGERKSETAETILLNTTTPIAASPHQSELSKKYSEYGTAAPLSVETTRTSTTLAFLQRVLVGNSQEPSLSTSASVEDSKPSASGVSVEPEGVTKTFQWTTNQSAFGNALSLSDHASAVDNRATPGAFGFGAAKSVSTRKPFFGAPKSDSAASFVFGTPNFRHEFRGTGAASPFVFGAPMSHDEPTFVFGEVDSKNNPEVASNFVFGGGKSHHGVASSTKFIFGEANSDESEPFVFRASQEAGSSKPALFQSSSTAKPTFSFGAAERKEPARLDARTSSKRSKNLFEVETSTAPFASDTQPKSRPSTFYSSSTTSRPSGYNSFTIPAFVSGDLEDDTKTVSTTISPCEGLRETMEDHFKTPEYTIERRTDGNPDYERSQLPMILQVDPVSIPIMLAFTPGTTHATNSNRPSAQIAIKSVAAPASSSTHRKRCGLIDGYKSSRSEHFAIEPSTLALYEYMSHPTIVSSRREKVETSFDDLKGSNK